VGERWWLAEAALALAARCDTMLVVAGACSHGARLMPVTRLARGRSVAGRVERTELELDVAGWAQERIGNLEQGLDGVAV
jgi:hypothetical protein